MRNDDRTRPWSPAHDLALVYLTLMHGADADIAEAEHDVMRERMRAWLPDHAEDLLTRVQEDVMLMYMSPRGSDMLDTSIESLAQTLSRTQRIAVLNDLAEIASADGVLKPGEVGFIQQLADYWEIAEDAARDGD